MKQNATIIANKVNKEKAVHKLNKAIASKKTETMERLESVRALNP